MKTTGIIWAYNGNPNKRTPQEAKAGDRIEWKRNGQRGSVKAIIKGWSDKNPKLVQVQNVDYPNWDKPVGRLKMIKATSILNFKN